MPIFVQTRKLLFFLLSFEYHCLHKKNIYLEQSQFSPKSIAFLWIFCQRPSPTLSLPQVRCMHRFTLIDPSCKGLSCAFKTHWCRPFINIVLVNRFLGNGSKRSEIDEVFWGLARLLRWIFMILFFFFFLSFLFLSTLTYFRIYEVIHCFIWNHLVVNYVI